MLVGGNQRSTVPNWIAHILQHSHKYTLKCLERDFKNSISRDNIYASH